MQAWGHRDKTRNYRPADVPSTGPVVPALRPAAARGIIFSAHGTAAPAACGPVFHPHTLLRMLLLIAFFLAALVVGAACGAALGYETRDLRNQPTGKRPWLIFAGVAVVVGSCSAVVNAINEAMTVSAAMKGASVVSGAVAFAITLYIFRKRL
jgi:hypothetical protein